MHRWPGFRCLAALLLGLGLWLAAGGLAQAQGIESVLSPGKLAAAHAKWQDECSQCHVKFDRAAQDRLCMDCHKDVGRDMRERSGYHGRLKPQACRSCHTDHKGANARIVEFDRKQFDHRLTDYPLRGKHQGTECDKCHAAGRKFSQAPSDCAACHRKDDVHKAALGAQCADCHGETNWKDARFDHASTRFALTGKHADARCADCHRDKRYQDTPRSCIGCHKRDDDGSKGHKGQFGERCDSCHGTKGWKPTLFNHDSDTKYALRGKHRGTACGDCHRGPLYKAKLPTECVDCHRKDDKHQGSVGRDCASCHTERDWKEKARFDHDKSRFPLLGRHRDTKCEACHKSPVFNQAPRECIGCHQGDDKHAGSLGRDCAACHGERDWKATQGRFDHAKTRFALRNAHAAATLRCDACHRDAKSFRHTPTDCVSCHRKDDRHEGQLGDRCDSCHGDARWKLPSFDHARARFVLTGRHLAVACGDCHRSLRYRDAQRECNACHAKDDKHRRALGTGCDSCHNARAWSIWRFDHERTNYRLEGLHRKVACGACHQQPAPAGRAAAPLATGCVSCHARDDVHDGGFGQRCEQCHGVEGWRQLQRRSGAASAGGRS